MGDRLFKINYQNFIIRNWETGDDRKNASNVISTVLQEYGLSWEPDNADKDVLEVEKYYFHRGGEFWVVELKGEIVGTAAFYPISRGKNAVEIRKMYLLPEVRGLGLGKFLLKELERNIISQGFQEIWIETASVLTEAVQLYEKNGYQPATGVETLRCDRVYVKKISPKDKMSL
ncbi:MAG: GNAT family N-acetyltransferase [Mastigocoleus sp.]